MSPKPTRQPRAVPPAREVEDDDPVEFPDTPERPARPAVRTERQPESETEGEPEPTHGLSGDEVVLSAEMPRFECDSCIYAKFRSDDPEAIGQCHRNPPVAQLFITGVDAGTPIVRTFSNWPWIKRNGPDSGCGEWKAGSVQ